MFTIIPSLVLVLILPLVAPSVLTPSTSQELQVGGHRTPRDTKQDSIKVVISEGCANQQDSSDVSQGGKEIDLAPGSPLVLTHKIKLVPSTSGSGSGSCGCEADFAALRERLERLEREVSALREKCGGADGGCCTSKESKGAGCSIKSGDECPNECSDQGRCVDGKCVCFSGYSGPDCSETNCPRNCNNSGRCVNGQCVCDPGFTGPDCSQRSCPDNCNNRGRCLNGRCVCNSDFTGPSCSEESCPKSCNNRGRCVNGQCVCNPGFTGPDCSKRDCPNNCNDHGRCVNGKCVCNSGFSGTDCSEHSCPGNCNNRGRCVNGQCVCKPGFTGADCSNQACPGNCNNRGRCVDGQCVCKPGFTGADCSNQACPGNCNKRGRCVNGQCVCKPGFTGADCSDQACPGNCNNRGRCVKGKCICNDGFTGPDCSERTCPNDCNDHGRCINGKCVCDSDFTGDDCSENRCPGNCNNRGRCVNGQCICDDGFTGPDCSERTCPNDCNDHGRCVNGKCVCDSDFTGDDCSENRCPENCNNRGRCVNGQCVCDDGFTGADCSENRCPGNCNNRGRCVNGQCVCDDGFTGADCSEKTCLNNCSNHGKCVNGKCVCSVGFAGQDCSSIDCPNNCSNKGRCVKGRCVCRRGFTGQDCSLCEEGKTGPNCDTVMSGVSQLSTRDITDTSVTLVWSPPPVQYDSYHITFTSQKESDQQITVQVEGSLTTFTQTGLAAGQEYTVTVTGEIDGRRGAESSAEFMTLISGPTNLQVVKTTTTSAVLQWEKSQGEIDRYHLTVTPRDGAEKSQEMTIPADRNSAHILQLEAGHLYDIIMVAEKGTSRSEPVTTQAVPGKTFPRVTTAALNMQVTLAPGQDVGNTDQEFNPSPEVQVFDQKGRREDEDKPDSVKVGGSDGPNIDSSTSVIARTKPLVSRTMATDGTNVRPTLSKKPNVLGHFRFNATRFVPKGRKVGSGPLTKPLLGEKRKVPLVPRKPKPVSPKFGDKTKSLTVSEPSIERSSSKMRDDKIPAIISGTGSETNRQSSLEELTEQPNGGMAGQENDTAPMPSEPTGTVQSQDKKCMNKIKVTHVRLPLKERGSGCREDGTVVVKNTDQGSDLGLSEIDRVPSDPDSSPDPLHKLLTDTFNSLNITTFSVHLSKPSNLSVGADTVRKQILTGLKPLSSFSSLSPSPSSSSQLPHPSSSQSSAAPSSSMPSSSLSLASRSQVPSLSTIATSQTYLIPTFSPLRASPLPSSSSSSSSNTDKLYSAGLSKVVDDNNKITTTAGSSKDMKLQPSRESGVPRFQQTSPKHGYVGHPLQKSGSLQNRTYQNLRIPHRPPLRLNAIPRRETETRHASSEESSLVEVNAPVMGASEDVVNTSVSSGVEQNQKKLPAGRRHIPVRRLPPKGGYLRRPFTHVGSFQNRTRPNLRLLTHPLRPLNPKTETQKEQVSPTELPATLSPPVSKDSYSAEGAVPVGPKQEGRYGTRISMTSMSTGLNQTVRGSRMPPPHRPTTKVGYFRRTHQYGGLSTNKTHLNLSPSQHPHRRLIHKPLLPTKINEGSSITAGSPSTQLRNDSIPEISAEQGVPRSTQEVRQSAEKETADVILSGQVDNNYTTIRPQTDELESSGNVLVQTIKSKEEETSNPESTFDSGIKKERPDSGNVNQGRPAIKQSSSDSRASIPITLLNKQLPTRSMTAQHRTQLKHYISGSQRGDDPKINHTARRVFDGKPEQTRHAASKPVKGPVSSSGVTREPLDYVGVTNRTSDGFTLLWDSPEGKYKNFVVTTKEAVKNKDPKQKEGRKDQQGEQDNFKKQSGKGQEARKHQPAREPENRNAEEENRLPQSVGTQIPLKQSSTTVEPATEHYKTLTKVLPGSARSFQFEDLFPQTEYTVTLLGKGPGLLSRLHKLVISTGPEPPSNIVFSKVTENSLTVSWTKPKTPVSGFKVTYTNTDDGEPMSVSVNSEDSTFSLSQLSPGSSYEVSVISTLGLDESDSIKELVMTLPDPPTDFQAVNVTDTKALLLWRPALAAIDKYAIVYGSGTDSELRISVSGNAAEQQLNGLEASTTYTVTITSQLGSLESSSATTTFTTTSGSGSDEDSPRDLQANNVTPRTALLSWKPPSKPFGSYRLTYQAEGHETKEVIVDASVTEYNLTRLHPGSKYMVQLQAEKGGRYMSAISTEFSTGTLRFPFPSDCSQELLNGIRTSGKVEIFPQGKLGTPLMVYCDMETDGGGWMVFQRRKDGSVNFFRRWNEYVRGFGDLNGEFWLGLDNLHNLTAMTRMSLRVDLRDGDESVFAKYSTFDVAKKNYRLTVGGYSGSAGDSLSYHNNRIFSTKDRDPAQFITRCAMSYRGGWWYKNCHEANLNGLYGINIKHQGVIWTAWKGKDYSIPFTEMKMRPAAFRPPTRG